MNIRNNILYTAIKDTIEALLSTGAHGHELEMLLRMEIEDTIQAVISDVGSRTGMQPAMIKLGNKVLSRAETIELLTQGIPYPQCLPIDKVALGLSMHLQNILPQEYTVGVYDGTTVTITCNGSEAAHIYLDKEKIHIFHGSDVDPTNVSSIQEMSMIFPTVCDFVGEMEKVEAEMSRKDTKKTSEPDKTPDDDGKPKPDFDWI